MQDTSYENWYNNHQKPGESYEQWFQRQGPPPVIIREAQPIVPPPPPPPPPTNTNTNTNTNNVNTQAITNALAGNFHPGSGDPWGKSHAGGVPYGGAKWFKHLLGTFGVNY